MRPMTMDVRAAFEAFPADVGRRLIEIRALILDVAAGDPRIGAITETLKWGEPAYLTAETGSGSTIRLGWPRKEPGRAAVYFICRTTLLDSFRERFAGVFDYEGERAVLVPVGGEIARGPLMEMIAMALTYHRR